MSRIPTIEELMSRELICARRWETFAKAYRTMHRARIHHLPVIDEEQRLVGVLSSSEVMEPPTRPRAESPVQRYLLRPEQTVLGDTDALTATDLMLASGLDALPVVDKSRKLIGVITETDLLRALRGMVAPASDGHARSLA